MSTSQTQYTDIFAFFLISHRFSDIIIILDIHNCYSFDLCYIFFKLFVVLFLSFSYFHTKLSYSKDWIQQYDFLIWELWFINLFVSFFHSGVADHISPLSSFPFFHSRLDSHLIRVCTSLVISLFYLSHQSFHTILSLNQSRFSPWILSSLFLFLIQIYFSSPLDENKTIFWTFPILFFKVAPSLWISLFLFLLRTVKKLKKGIFKYNRVLNCILQSYYQCTIIRPITWSHFKYSHIHVHV